MSSGKKDIAFKMLKLQLCLFVSFVFCCSLAAQDYIWTGNGADTDFFNEENWVDVVTSQPPPTGSLEPTQVINKNLLLSCEVTTKISQGVTIGSQTPGIFEIGQSQVWPYVFTVTTPNDGAKSQLSQTIEINITSLPSTEESFRIVKTVANGNWNNGNPQALTLGSNVFTVTGVSFDRTVKIQFSSPDITFNSLQVNDEIILSEVLEPIILGDSNVLEITNGTLKAQSFSGDKIILNDDSYVNLSSADPLPNGADIDFMASSTWLQLNQVKPTSVYDNYMSQFVVDGAAATHPTTIRLDNYYQNGTVIRPENSQSTPLTIYDAGSLTGTSANIVIDQIFTGTSIPNQLNNTIRSFVLKRGHMLTFATNEDGTGASKAYIASESDLALHSLPAEMDNNVSFIRVIPWNWVSKKGTGGDIAGMGNTWFYKWNNREVSDLQREFAPMAWGKGGADEDSDIDIYRTNYKATHVLGFNEPDDCFGQSGQFQNMCQEDVAILVYKNLLKTGLRMVSPAGRQGAALSWVDTFNDLAVQNDIRIDVIAVHWYDWNASPQDSPNANASLIFERFKTYLSNVYANYGLPIWITEFNANKHRTQAVNQAFMELAIPYLESLAYVERYAWFEPLPSSPDGQFGNGEFYDSAGAFTQLGTFYSTYQSGASVPEEYYSGPDNLDNSTAENQYNYVCNTSNLLANSRTTIRQQSKLQIVPNPATHHIELIFQEPIEMVYIYNISGALIRKHISNKKIDVSSLKPGIYFLNANGHYAKFIKN